MTFDVRDCCSNFGKNRFWASYVETVPDSSIVGGDGRGFLICINLSVIMLPIYLCRVGLKSTLTCRQVKLGKANPEAFANLCHGGSHTISAFSCKKC